MRRASRILSALLALAVLSGCLYIPPFGRMRSDALERIEVGVTTRGEVRALLGDPDLLEHERWEGYATYHSGGVFLVAAPSGHVGGGDIDRTDYAVFVRYHGPGEAEPVRELSIEAHGAGAEGPTETVEEAGRETLLTFDAPSNAPLLVAPGRFVGVVRTTHRTFGAPEARLVVAGRHEPIALAWPAGVRPDVGGPFFAFARGAGSRVAAVTTRGVVAWDARDGRFVSRLDARPRRDPAPSLVFLDDGGRAAGTGLGVSKAAVTVWDVETGDLVARHDSGLAPARALATFPGGGTLLVVGRDRSVLMDASSGEVLDELGHGRSEVIGGAVSPDGRRVALLCASHAQLWSSDGRRLGGLERVIPLGTRRAGRGRGWIGFSPDGALLTATHGSERGVWDAGTGELIWAGSGEGWGAVAWEDEASVIVHQGDRVERVRLARGRTRALPAPEAPEEEGDSPERRAVRPD